MGLATLRNDCQRIQAFLRAASLQLWRAGGVRDQDKAAHD